MTRKLYLLYALTGCLFIGLFGFLLSDGSSPASAGSGTPNRSGLRRSHEMRSQAFVDSRDRISGPDSLRADGADAEKSAEEGAYSACDARSGLPIVFLLGDLEVSPLNGDEYAIVMELQEQFSKAVADSPEKDPKAGEYHGYWKSARENSDNLLRLRLGLDGFNRFTSLAAQAEERRRISNREPDMIQND